MPKNRLTERLAGIKETKETPPSFMPPPEAKPVRSNTREQERTTCYRFGKVHYGDFEPIAFVIRDISDTGAQIVLEHACQLPAHVDLKSPAAGFSRKAVVVWQDGPKVGLKFVVEN